MKKEIYLAQNKGKIVKPEFGYSEFYDSCIKAFPNISKEINGNDDIHRITSTLANESLNAIKSGDFSYLTEIFQYVKNILEIPLRDIDSEIINSIYISYLTLHDFEQSENGKKAWEIVPELIKDVIENAV